MKKLFLIFTLIFLLGISCVDAQPPFQAQETASLTTGLQIETVRNEFLKQGEDIVASIRVYNISNGFKMDNTTTTCNLHIYNSSGNHLMDQPFAFNDDHGDFEIDVDGGNFSSVGFRSFIVGCNTSNEGGFIGGGITVTADGFGEGGYNNYSFLIPVIILIFLSILIVIGFALTDKQIVKVCCGLGLSFMFMILFRLSAWFIEITNSSETALIYTINFYWSIAVRVFYFGVAGVLIYLVAYIVASIMKDKKRKEEDGDLGLGKL